MEQLVDIDGAADLLGLTVQSLRRRIARKTFVIPFDPNTETGPWWRVADLEAWDNNRRK